MLSTLSKIVTQQHHELYYDRLKMFMQPLKLDHDQAAPESQEQTAAATLPQMFAAQHLQSEVNSGTARVFRSPVEQDKLKDDVISAFGQYDNEHGFTGPNGMFKGDFGEELCQLQRPDPTSAAGMNILSLS